MTSPLLAAGVAALLGLPAGTLANVVIDRVPRREPLARPWPCWLSCAVPAVMATLWFAVTWRLVGARLAAAAPAYLVLTFVCVVLTVIDATTRKLPNRVTYPAFPAVGVLLAVASLAEHDLGRLGRALVAAAVVGALFLVLFLISPRGMGFGDVKFAPTLGIALGWLSWPVVAVGVVSAFLLGGMAGVVAMVVLRLGRKALLPFGPWLAAGALLGVLYGHQLASWYGRALLG